MKWNQSICGKLGARITVYVFLLLLCLQATSVLAKPESIEGDLTIFHAGSLTVPLRAMVEGFNSTYPDIRVIRKGGGSTAMARKIAIEGEEADIMASADYKVIDSNLIPEFADWNVRFAKNQLVLCYSDKSKYAETINSENWFKILQMADVRWGHSDPNLDPCGYRSLMVMQLAEKFYGVDGLYNALLKNRPTENVKEKAVMLVQMLKDGELDYGWEYLSVAVQHGLRYVVLDDKINLGNYKYDDYYSQAEVRVTGKKPGTWKTKKGKSITYGVTMIKDCPHPKAAIAFMNYLLSAENGLEILKKMGQPPFIPARVPTQNMKMKLPDSLSSVVEVR